MKTLTRLVAENEQKLEIQENSLNYIPTEQLKQYLSIANKFLSEDAKNIINWLIEHPNYVKELANGNSKNALATFFNNGTPTQQGFKDLYRWMKNVVKMNRIIEIPVFQTKEQFDSIINKTISPDEIILDFSTEKSRNEIAKKYDPLVWKIARSFVGKCEFSLEELHASGLYGLVKAMNDYGKKTDKNLAGEEAIKSTTFTQYAAYIIRVWILEDIKDRSHLVRIPRSQQKAERSETGFNTKTNSISVETTVGKDKDGNKQSLLNKLGDFERAGKSLEFEDNEKLWDGIHKKLAKKFDKDSLDLFYSIFGLRGYKKLSGKELMDKYKLKNPANVTVIKNRIIQYMIKDPALYNALLELYEFTNECRHDDDVEDRDFEPIHLNLSKNYIFDIGE